MSKIITFGDSHSMFGWPKYIINHHIGPRLAYSFGRDKLKFLDLTQYDIDEGDHIIFCFGEIDCRCHVNKRHDNYTHNISNILYNYVDAIEQNLVKLDKHVNVWLYNVVPPAIKGTFWENPDQPLIGTDAQRKEYVQCFNKGLALHCILKGWKFFNIYDKYTNHNGMLNPELSDGNVHIKDGKYIEEFIKTHKIN